MLNFKIGDTPVIVTRIKQRLNDFALSALQEQAAQRVHFIGFRPDFAQLRALFATRVALGQSATLSVKTWRGFYGLPATPREREVKMAQEAIFKMLGSSNTIITQAEPCISVFKDRGECLHSDTALVVNMAPDAVLAALYATRVGYPGKEADARSLREERAMQRFSNDRFSLPLLNLLKSLEMIRPYSRKDWDSLRAARDKSFESFIGAAQGCTETSAWLTDRAAEYDRRAAVACELARTAHEIVPGVPYLDLVERNHRYVLTVLVREILERPGTKAVALRVSYGAIARRTINEYRLILAGQFRGVNPRGSVDLRALLPAGTVVSRHAGVIVPRPWRMHMCEHIWSTVVLPALRAEAITANSRSEVVPLVRCAVRR